MAMQHVWPMIEKLKHIFHKQFQMLKNQV